MQNVVIQKNWPVNGLCGKCLSVWSPLPPLDGEEGVPPAPKAGGTHLPGVEGVGGQYFEDARHWIDLLQYNLSTGTGVQGRVQITKLGWKSWLKVRKKLAISI